MTKQDGICSNSASLVQNRSLATDQLAGEQTPQESKFPLYYLNNRIDSQRVPIMRKWIMDYTSLSEMGNILMQ